MSTLLARLHPFLLVVCGLAFVSATPAAAHPRQDTREAFREQFGKLAELGATEELRKLVQKNLDHTVEWVIETTEAISNEPSDRLYELLKNLRSAWKSAQATDFVDQMERYFSLLDPNVKRERVRLREEYDRGSSRYAKAIQDPGSSSGDFIELSDTFEHIGTLFEQFGDKYYASQCWSFFGSCNDEFFRKGDADLYKACRGFGKVVSLRKEIGLEDSVYVTTKPRWEELEKQGFGAEPADAGTPADAGAPAAAAESAPAVRAPMSFDLVTDFEAVARPNYFLDELYPLWNAIGLAKKGTNTDFPRLPEAPKVLRPGANEVVVDLDADGKGDVEVPLTGNLEPVQFDVGKGDEARPWGFLAVVGIQKDTYQTFEMNLSPNDDTLLVFIAPAASMTGTIGATAVRVFDDNMDGVYGSPSMSYGHIGVTEGIFAPEMDSIVVGEETRARPWSEVQEIGGSWYKLAVEQGGKTIAATPTTVKTGKLKLKFKGPEKPSWVIVKGAATWENCYYDLAGAGAQGLTVPAGRYTLHYGELRSGKKKQMIKTLILPGRNSPSWSVPEGGEATVELGAPFGFEFKFQTTDEAIKILGNSVVVVGAANERYERPWGCVPRPEAAYRKKGSKKGGKPEKMDLVQTQEEVGQLGWASAWFPRDLELPKKSDETEVEVQLVEKNNKLFGKIESEWKE